MTKKYFAEMHCKTCDATIPCESLTEAEQRGRIHSKETFPDSHNTTWYLLNS